MPPLTALMRYLAGVLFVVLQFENASLYATMYKKHQKERSYE